MNIKKKKNGEPLITVKNLQRYTIPGIRTHGLKIRGWVVYPLGHYKVKGSATRSYICNLNWLLDHHCEHRGRGCFTPPSHTRVSR